MHKKRADSVPTVVKSLKNKNSSLAGTVRLMSASDQADQRGALDGIQYNRYIKQHIKLTLEY